jgi:hypothetical protein
MNELWSYSFPIIVFNLGFLLLHACVQKFLDMKLFTAICSSIILVGISAPKILSDNPPLQDV